MKERERDKRKRSAPETSGPENAGNPDPKAARRFRARVPSARFVVAFSSRAKKCRRKIRSLSSRRLAVDFFPSRRPSTRRASFGVFCCSLFIYRRNRKGTTTSCSARQSASRDRNETNRKTRKRTLTIFVPKQNARRLVLTLAWHQSPRVHLAPRTQCDDKRR